MTVALALCLSQGTCQKFIVRNKILTRRSTLAYSGLVPGDANCVNSILTAVALSAMSITVHMSKIHCVL